MCLNFTVTETLIPYTARFLRHLAANGTIRETDVGTYASTRLSASFRQKSFKDAIHFMYDFSSGSFAPVL
jgi:hypothetical protein